MEVSEEMPDEPNLFLRAFDTAILDGPFKIYFSENHEEIALELYSRLQKEVNRKNDSEEKNIYILLYPNQEVFLSSFFDSELSSVEGRSFDEHVFSGEKVFKSTYIKAQFQDDVVFGVKGVDEGFCMDSLMIDIKEQAFDNVLIN